MIWILAGIITLLLGLVIHFSRKQAVNAKKSLDLESALARKLEDEKKSAAIDADVSVNRSDFRKWLRGQNIKN
jgi:hypothetical protein